MKMEIRKVPFLARDNVEHARIPRQRGRRFYRETHQDS